MRVLTAIPQEDLNDVTAAAQAAEAAGYDGLVTMENKHNPFLAIGVAAVATTRVELATSVAIAFPRSPMVTAGIAHDLQRASRGRLVLGLGPQIRPHNEKRFSVPWSAPAPRMREYVEGMRAIWRAWERGEKLDYRGQHYTFTLMTPNFRPSPTGQRMVPVTLAAVGPHMLRLAGEIADGVRLHGFCTQRYLDDVVLPLVGEGLAKGGRTRDQFEISGGGFVATGPDDAAVQTMVEWVRYRVAFYGSTPGYWPVFDLHGLGELGRKLNVMSKAGQWDEMTREISDDVVRLFAAVGTHREIAREIGRRFGGRVDTLALGGVPPEIVQDVRRIPSRFAGYR
jgi:probable F420-dependent oxidoreductase